MKKFCIAGPVDPKRHFFIPKRLNRAEVDTLIDDRQYFVLHAPRQSGKTTAIEEYIAYLNEGGVYSALYINVESAQAARDNIKEATIAILAELKASLMNQLKNEKATIQYLEKVLREPQLVNLASFSEALEFWTKASLKPTVLFIDEIDSLIGDSLLSILRQIRRGFSNRPKTFPQSICLIGLRDVRDYRIWSRESENYISTSSPFNIKAKSLLLNNFSVKEVAELYAQHTQETNQIFENEAIEYAFYLTQGQPWLVNALAHEAVYVEVTDLSLPITKQAIECAKNTLIKRRDTHLDSLIHKLKEERVRPLIDAIIQGDTDILNLDVDGVQYVRDLGLIKQDRMEIANPIYQEIIPRELTALVSEGLGEKFLKRPGYITEGGLLNLTALLEAFTEFYRENSAIWLEQFEYKEAGPHLLLMAFLQRIINGGGTIQREYALGRGRVDLLIKWQSQRIVVELKIKRGEKTLREGLEQTVRYMDGANATEGHLIIFDRQTQKTWSEKGLHKEECSMNHKIQVWEL